MSRSNRSLNRILLLVLGVAWLATGAWLVLRQALPDALAPVQPALDAATGLQPFGIPLDWAIVSAAAGGALVLLAIVHTATRGRGRTGDAAVAGSVVVDRAAVRDVLRQELGDHPDVLDVSVQPWRRRRTAAWRVVVHTRTGAALDRIVDRTADAARATRDALGTDAPILVHIAGGLRAAVASDRRAA